MLYVPPPDLEAWYEILGLHTQNMKTGNDVDLRRIAEDTELFTGAELEGLCREARNSSSEGKHICNHSQQSTFPNSGVTKTSFNKRRN